MMRLMGLILMVIAVECFVSGFKADRRRHFAALEPRGTKGKALLSLQLQYSPVRVLFCMSCLFNMMLCFKRKKADKCGQNGHDIFIFQELIPTQNNRINPFSLSFFSFAKG